jgi:hypothetical protein
MCLEHSERKERNMKKALSYLLAITLLFSTLSIMPLNASATATVEKITDFQDENLLFAPEPSNAANLTLSLDTDANENTALTYTSSGTAGNSNGSNYIYKDYFNRPTDATGIVFKVTIPADTVGSFVPVIIDYTTGGQTKIEFVGTNTMNMTLVSLSGTVQTGQDIEAGFDGYVFLSFTDTYLTTDKVQLGFEFSGSASAYTASAIIDDIYFYSGSVVSDYVSILSAMNFDVPPPPLPDSTVVKINDFEGTNDSSNPMTFRPDQAANSTLSYNTVDGNTALTFASTGTGGNKDMLNVVYIDQILKPIEIDATGIVLKLTIPADTVGNFVPNLLEYTSGGQRVFYNSESMTLVSKTGEVKTNEALKAGFDGYVFLTFIDKIITTPIVQLGFNFSGSDTDYTASATIDDIYFYEGIPAADYVTILKQLNFDVPVIIANTDLQSLSYDKGTISPVFKAETKNYTIEVLNSATSIQIGASAVDPNAVIKINNEAVSTKAISLNATGNTNVGISVINDTANSVYNITVKKVAAYVKHIIQPADFADAPANGQILGYAKKANGLVEISAPTAVWGYGTLPYKASVMSTDQWSNFTGFGFRVVNPTSTAGSFGFTTTVATRLPLTRSNAILYNKDGTTNGTHIDYQPTGDPHFTIPASFDGYIYINFADCSTADKAMINQITDNGISCFNYGSGVPIQLGNIFLFSATDYSVLTQMLVEQSSFTYMNVFDSSTITSTIPSTHGGYNMEIVPSPSDNLLTIGPNEGFDWGYAYIPYDPNVMGDKTWQDYTGLAVKIKNTSATQDTTFGLDLLNNPREFFTYTNAHLMNKDGTVNNTEIHYATSGDASFTVPAGFDGYIFMDFKDVQNWTDTSSPPSGDGIAVFNFQIGTTYKMGSLYVYTGTNYSGITNRLQAEYQAIFDGRSDLTDLSVNNIAISPDFSADVTTYTAATNLTEATVNATSVEGATIAYKFNDTVHSGHVFTLSKDGNNKVSVIVTSKDLSKITTYEIAITVVDKITPKSDTYTIGNGLITQVPLKTTIATFLGNLTSSAGVRIFDLDGITEITDTTQYVGTGIQVKLIAGDTVIDSLTITIIGDADGDGTVTSSDALLALQISTRRVTASEAQKIALDVDGEPNITSSDALLILQYSTKRITSF